jgi:hypothetical protein
MAGRTDRRAIRITRIESRVAMAVGAGYVLAAAAVVLGLVAASGANDPRRAEGLAISALALVLALVLALLGFITRQVIKRMEIDGL